MRTSSSKRWLQEHFSDRFVKQAQQSGFRARSIFKLIEIQEQYKIIQPDFIVVDLGAAPGSWSEYVAKLLTKGRGKLYALDILPMNPMLGVEIIRGDFTDSKVQTELSNQLGANSVDVVLSDMAPNLSGIADVDQHRASNLTNSALVFACKVLKPGGTFLVKVFQGNEFNMFLTKLKRSFREVKIIKPEASRARSKELFLLARQFVLQ